MKQPRTAYPVAPSYYYVVPTTTYLRSCASYADECYVVAQVFSGDRVTVLDRNDYNWARVQLDRSGVIGWIPGELLTPSPVPSSFYVAWNSVYLRDCADYNCRSVELLHRGDRVDKIDQDYRGWWRVRSIKSGITGWVPGLGGGSQPRAALFLCGGEQPGPAGRPQHRQPHPHHFEPQRPGGDAGRQCRRLVPGARPAHQHHRLGGVPLPGILSGELPPGGSQESGPRPRRAAPEEEAPAPAPAKPKAM